MKFRLFMAIVAISVTLCPGIGISGNTDKDRPLQNIALGPGTLDLDASFRLRYENLHQYNIRKYGTGREKAVSTKLITHWGAFISSAISEKTL
jgi:hypothetical protein